MLALFRSTSVSPFVPVTMYTIPPVQIADFNPATDRSGRFMLLKFWSPAPDENIDIQSVVAHGFAGPRFFPAKEMR